MCILPISLLAYIQDSTFLFPLQPLFYHFCHKKIASLGLIIAFFTIYARIEANIICNHNCIQAVPIARPRDPSLPRELSWYGCCSRYFLPAEGGQEAPGRRPAGENGVLYPGTSCFSLNTFIHFLENVVYYKANRNQSNRSDNL